MQKPNSLETANVLGENQNIDCTPVFESSFVFCKNKIFGCKETFTKAGLFGHLEVCEYKSLPCFLGEDCNHTVVPVKHYTQHLTDVHQVRVCRPLLLSRSQFSITFRLTGTELTSNIVIWKCGKEEFIPIGRLQNDKFKFGVIWIGACQSQQQAISVKMKVTKPGGQNFANLGQSSIKIQVPISPIRVSGDGNLDLEGSDCVVLNKGVLEHCCKKSVKKNNNCVEWQWVVCSG